MRLPSLGGALLAGFLLAGCMTSDARRADELVAVGDWDGAVAAYREALKKDPHDRALQQRSDYAKSAAAERHYAEGRQHLQNNRISEALQEFKLALGLDPSRREHHAAMGDAIRLKESRDELQAAEKLLRLGRLDEALDAYERAVRLDPSLIEALEGITATTAKQRAAKAISGSAQPITLRFQNAKLKEVFEIVAHSAGINVIFDKDVRDDPITIFIKDLPLDEALNLILNTNALLSRRIGPDTLLIIPNTKPKLDQYQDLMIRTFYLSNAKAKEVVNLLRTMLESKRIYVDEHLNAVVMRDQPAKILLAERMIMSVDRRESEVELDVEVLEVDRTKSLKYGQNFAKQAGFGIVPPDFTGSLSTNVTQFTYQQLTSLGPSSFLFTFPASVLLDFFKQESNAKTLAAPKLRVVNNKSASVNIGDKQPILLSTTNVLPGQAATGAVPTTSTVTSIEYKDTGVKLTVEPTVNLVDELTLKLKIEVTRLGDLITLQQSPLIQQFRFGTRVAETVLNIKDDETIVLAGLIQDEDRKTRNTVPGLGDIPILGQLFSSTTVDVIQTEVVLTITPHIVRNIMTPNTESLAFWSGTEATYATAPLFPTEVVGSGQQPVGKPMSVPSPPVPSGMPVQPLAPVAPAAPFGAPAVPQPVVPQFVPQVEPEPPPSPPVQVTPQAGPPPVPTTQPKIAARGAAVLAIRPSQLSAGVGQPVQVDLRAEQLESLTESIVTVTYDPKVLEIRQALEGDLVKQTGVPAGVTVSTDPAAGYVTLHLRRQEGGAVAGSGALATLVFNAKGAGTSPLTIQQATVVGGSKTIPVTLERAVVQVQ